MDACIPPLIAALDASSALNRCGVHCYLDLFVYDDVAPAAMHALNIWASAQRATLVLSPETNCTRVMLGETCVANLFRVTLASVAVDSPKIVVEVGMVGR